MQQFKVVDGNGCLVGFIVDGHIYKSMHTFIHPILDERKSVELDVHVTALCVLLVGHE